MWQIMLTVYPTWSCRIHKSLGKKEMMLEIHGQAFQASVLLWEGEEVGLVIAQQLRHWLLFWRPQTWFLVPTWWLITARNSNFRGSDALIWPPRAPFLSHIHTSLHTGTHSWKQNKSFEKQKTKHKKTKQTNWLWWHGWDLSPRHCAGDSGVVGQLA